MLFITFKLINFYFFCCTFANKSILLISELCKNMTKNNEFFLISFSHYSSINFLNCAKAVLELRIKLFLLLSLILNQIISYSLSQALETQSKQLIYVNTCNHQVFWVKLHTQQGAFTQQYMVYNCAGNFSYKSLTSVMFEYDNC